MSASASDVNKLVQASISVDVTKANSALESFEKSVKNIGDSLEALNNVDVGSSVQKFENILQGVSIVFERVKLNLDSLSSFNKLSSGVNKLANSFKILSDGSINTTTAFKTLKQIMDGLGAESLEVNVDLVRLKSSEAQVKSETVSLSSQLAELTSDFTSVSSKSTQLKSSLNNVDKEFDEVNQSSNTASQSVDRFGNKSRSASGDVQNISNKVNTLDKNLKNVSNSLGYVGRALRDKFSRIFDDITHKISDAIVTTYKSKSEMNSWLDMLNLTRGQIKGFNNALDETVKKFQRVNKYHIGETIASIGVEFDLSADEMKEALDVTAMITNEYLRAGRNSSEASLAVKDILQGQFQRLSRETGVKEKNLLEAGWSGDDSDTMGLLKALKKVGEDRNWDVMAQKASSFNDIMTIGQNKVSTWSADIIDKFTPALVRAFNELVVVGEDLGAVIGGIVSWLGSPGWAQTTIKVIGLTGALVGGLSALVHYRTGATLLQIAQMGLSGSITATILGLEAQTVAERGLFTAISMSITGLEAEQVVRIGRLKSIFATVVGLDMEIVSQEGLWVAIVSATTGAEVQTIVNEGLAASILAVTAATVPAVAIIGVFAAAFVTLMISVWDSTRRMESFYNLIENKDDVIDEAKSNVDSLKKKQDGLRKTQEQYVVGSKEYINVGNAIKQLDEDIGDAKTKVKEAQEAVNIAQRSQELFDTTKLEKQLELERNINSALVKVGISSEEARLLSSDYLREATDGSHQLYETLQKVVDQYHKTAGAVVKNTEKLKEAGYTDVEIEVKIKPIISAGGKISRGKEKMGTATGFMEYIDGWLLSQQGQLENFFAEFSINYDTGGIGAALEGALKGIGWGLAKLPIFKDFWGWVFEVSGLTKYQHRGMEGLSSFLIDSLKNLIQNVVPGGGLLADSYNLVEPLIKFFSDGFDYLFSLEWLKDIINSSNRSKSLDIMGLLNNLFSMEDSLSGVGEWVNSNIITPFGSAISSGLSNIPIVGDILNMLGLVSQNNQDAYNTGYDLMTKLGEGVSKKIGEIPIIRDIARMLGLIPSQNEDAKSKGDTLGSKIKEGVRGGINGISKFVADEMRDVVNAIKDAAPKAFDAGNVVGSAIWGGMNFVLKRHSPGFIHDEVLAEFGTDIPDAIRGSGDYAYSNAQYYGQRIVDGIRSSSQTTIGLDNMVGEYQDDAQIIATSSQMMGVTTTNAFNQMQNQVNLSTTQMSGTVVNSYTSMQQKQSTLLDNMKTSNTTAYNEMYLKSNQSLLQMRDSTSNVTNQMIGAWHHMKDSIVSSANKLKSESTAHFTQLSSTIGSFYRKIQNPSNWGAGVPTIPRGRNPSAGRRLLSVTRGKHGAGVSPYGKFNEKLTIKDLMTTLNMSDSTRVDLNTFLASIFGEHGFGWNGWNKTHFNYIKNKTNQWNMKPLMIMGRIPAGNGFKVGEFANGTPHLTWDSFIATAESLFSKIPYSFYYDSQKWGSWQNALMNGEANCSDGADALIALASTFGFGGGTKVHTTLRNGVGHFYAVINGKKMDTTNFQNNHSWSPLGGAGKPRTRSSSAGIPNKTINITVDMRDSTIYGVDELENKIEEASKRGMREYFNDSYSIPL